jgi:hypothetical protein
VRRRGGRWELPKFVIYPQFAESRSKSEKYGKASEGAKTRLKMRDGHTLSIPLREWHLYYRVYRLPPKHLVEFDPS